MIEELTQSMINMFYRCGAQFENRYIKGIKRPPGVATKKGTGTHAGVEYGYNKKIETGEFPPEDEVADAAHDEAQWKELTK